MFSRDFSARSLFILSGTSDYLLESARLVKISMNYIFVAEPDFDNLLDWK